MAQSKKAAKSFEETLWDSANKLRGSVESSDWSGAIETTRQGCPQGDRGSANQFHPQMDEAKALDQTITENLKSLSYGRK